MRTHARQRRHRFRRSVRMQRALRHENGRDQSRRSQSSTRRSHQRTEFIQHALRIARLRIAKARQHRRSREQHALGFIRDRREQTIARVTDANHFGSVLVEQSPRDTRAFRGVFRSLRQRFFKESLRGGRVRDGGHRRLLRHARAVPRQLHRDDETHAHQQQLMIDDRRAPRKTADSARDARTRPCMLLSGASI